MSKFIKEMYKLSKKQKSLDFFDKIKSSCEKWIDGELKLKYTLSLDGEDDDCLYIGFNKPYSDNLNQEEIDKEIEELEKFENLFIKKN